MSDADYDAGWTQGVVRGIGYSEESMSEMMQRIAQHEATIEVLKNDLAKHVGNEMLQSVEIADLREQLARMPVCAGYVDLVDIVALQNLQDGDDMYVAGVHRNKVDLIKHPIYIDPPGQEQKG